jgi:phosphate transport system substrate-binding protein
VDGNYTGIYHFEKVQRRMIMQATKIFGLFCLSGISFITACNTKQPKYTDTPVSGILNISVDESFAPMIKSQAETFTGIYKAATINTVYKPEFDVFNDLVNDSVRFIITSRTMTEEVRKYFESKKLFPAVSKIAVDAVALIVHKDNPDTSLTYEQVSGMFQGKIISWKEINPDSKADSLVIVFDNERSSNARYIQEKFLEGNPLSRNCYAVNSNQAVIDYVEKNPSSMGIIALNYISDRDNPQSNEFLSRISVCAIALPDTSEDKEFYKPYQAYLALKKYPLSREVYSITTEGRAGLGTGFASFLAGDQGQRIIKLEGLLPATMPIRIINMN